MIMEGKSPQKFELERAYREVCMKLAETESNIMMFTNMIRKKVATNDVRSFTLKQAAQCRIYKEASLRLEKVAMKIKKVDALAYAKRLNQEKNRIKQSLVIFSNDRKTTRHIRYINKNSGEYRSYLSSLKEEKVQHLLDKRSCEGQMKIDRCPRKVREILKNVKIFSKEVTEQKPIVIQTSSYLPVSLSY